MYGYNTTNNVWLNYKLVNVQWVPAGNKSQKVAGNLYGNTSGNVKPLIPVESYYLSNSLVETNMVLSAFSGQFNFGAGDELSITDFYYQPTQYTNNNVSGSSVMKNLGDPFYNVYTKGGPYNMGGCMGCHGNTTVNGGSDASFILGHGTPFVIEGIDPPPQTMLLRHRSYLEYNKTGVRLSGLLGTARLAAGEAQQNTYKTPAPEFPSDATSEIRSLLLLYEPL